MNLDSGKMNDSKDESVTLNAPQSSSNSSVVASQTLRSDVKTTTK